MAVCRLQMCWGIYQILGALALLSAYELLGSCSDPSSSPNAPTNTVTGASLAKLCQMTIRQAQEIMSRIAPCSIPVSLAHKTRCKHIELQTALLAITCSSTQRLCASCAARPTCVLTTRSCRCHFPRRPKPICISMHSTDCLPEALVTTHAVHCSPPNRRE